MASLQELLSRSVGQNLGLSGALAQRQRETEQLASNVVRRGQLEGEKIKSSAAKKRGLFSTIGTVLGAAGGFAFGGLKGAEIGATVGGGLGGVASGKADQGRGEGAVSGAIQTGLGLASAFQDKKVAKQEKAAERAEKKAQQEFDNKIKVAELEIKAGATGSQRRKLIDQQVVKLQGKGARIATAKDEKNLPSQAFITLGTGDKTTKLVKPVKPLSAESATKFSVARKAKEGAQSLLKEFETNKDLGNSLRGAGTFLFKRTKKAQKAAAKLDLVTEGLGRALSGAAVPESEIKSFRALFAVNTLDSDDTIKFKLQRSVDIVQDLENLMKFGADTTEIQDYLQNQKEEVPQETRATSPIQETVIRFDAAGNRI